MQSKAKRTAISEIFGLVQYHIAFMLDHVLSYMARFMPFARPKLLKLIKQLREIDEEPFDTYEFEHKNYGVGMSCPSCYYDMSYIYDSLTPEDDNPNGKYMRIGTKRSVFSWDAFGAKEWTVECTCPICKTKFDFDDQNY